MLASFYVSGQSLRGNAPGGLPMQLVGWLHVNCRSAL